MGFSDVESARAAFALGGLRYRCRKCGRWHTSGSSRSQSCLKQWAEWHNWVRVLGPAPPDPVVPPSLAFVYEYWQRVRPRGVPSFPDSCVLPGEWVLAVDGGWGLREAIEQELEAKCAESMAEIARGWEQYELICAWMRDLMGCSVPGEIVSVEYGVHPMLPPLYCITTYDVRSAVPGPDGAVLHRVTADSLASCWFDSLKGRRDQPSWSRLRAPLHVEYGRNWFLVVVPAHVLSRWSLKQGVMVEFNVSEYLACVDRGGEFVVLFLGENDLCLKRVIRRARERCGLA